MWERPEQGHSLDHLFACDSSPVDLGVGGGTVKCGHWGHVLSRNRKCELSTVQGQAVRRRQVTKE